ncbi:outer membrane protein assembly factor BamC [Shewanella sp.]|uniref:outer membrane protein assembly factor BamC n=1 Tax=Shewanella sp. TaxID=50422 RepID=UPI004053F676
MLVKVKLKQVTPILLVAAVSAACSTPIDRRQVNGTDEYINAEVTAGLNIPASLKTPPYTKEYDIPPVGTKANTAIVGKKLDIRAPLQVLPMAEGTRVEENSDNIRVVIESIDNSIDLKQEIFDTIRGSLTESGITVLAENFTTGFIETDWITNEEVIESNWWSADKIYQLRQRYRYDIAIKPHGRTADVTINLVEHEEHYNGENQGVLLSGEDKRRYTIDRLNSSVAYMSAKREQLLKENRLRQSRGIELQLIAAQGKQGAYWLANGKFKQVWDRLRIVLPELGFDVLDMDMNKGLYYVNLEESGGFWSSLWGDESLELDKGNYRVVLTVSDDTDKTNIYLKDVAGEPVDDEVMAQVFKSLADLMQTDRKVR